MKYLDLDKPIEHNLKLGAVPTEDHYKNLIKEDTIIKMAGKTILVYLTNRNEFSNLMQLCNELPYDSSERASGLLTISRIFGYAPRNTMRKLPCRATQTIIKFPDYHKQLEKAGSYLTEFYRLYNPEQLGKHKELTQKNNSVSYTLPDGVFTSGIINVNNALRYHYDSGNYNDVWSAMITLKKDIAGGYLSIPELGVGIELSHKSALFFDGQSIMHGVTPITRLKKESKRYTIVYYSLARLWACLPYKEEIKSMNKVQMETMKNRLAGKPIIFQKPKK